jgi:hypothetical protein
VTRKPSSSLPTRETEGALELENDCAVGPISNLEDQRVGVLEGLEVENLTVPVLLTPGVGGESPNLAQLES